jgi:hypothetical protein
MNRIVLIVSVIIAAVICCTAQEPTFLGTEQLYSRSYAGFSGSVRTVLSVSQRPMGSSTRTFSTAAETFDPTGAITDSVFHYADIEIHSGELVSLDSSRSYAYDSKRKLIRSVGYDPSGTVTGQDDYRYESTGRLIEVIDHSRNGTISEKRLFSYDIPKRQVTVTWTTYYIKPSTKYFVYTFDTKGRAIERTTLNDDRSLYHRIIYSYDANGTLTKEEHYDEKNQYGWGQIYTYKLDAKGNWYECQNKYTQPDKEPTVDMVTYRVITYYGQDR